MTTTTRAATPADIDRIVDLCETERRRYQNSPSGGGGRGEGFYTVDATYADKKRESVGKLIDGDTLALVHETNGSVDGVILGIVVPAPPVYNPGGKVCLLTDFVAPTAALLDAANKRVHDLGAVLFIADCMRAAKDKQHALTSVGFHVASDWYHHDIDIPEPKKPIDGVIEPATAADIPAIEEICERRRLEYQKYQPLFWKKADDSSEKHSGYLNWMLGQAKSIALVHRSEGKIDGFIIANPFAKLPYADGQLCDIDDFTVADDHDWNVGSWLLHHATVDAKAKGATVTQVVVPNAEHPKRHMLEHMGFDLGHQWLIRPVTS